MDLHNKRLRPKHSLKLAVEPRRAPAFHVRQVPAISPKIIRYLMRMLGPTMSQQ